MAQIVYYLERSAAFLFCANDLSKISKFVRIRGQTLDIGDFLSSADGNKKSQKKCQKSWKFQFDASSCKIFATFSRVRFRHGERSGSVPLRRDEQAHHELPCHRFDSLSALKVDSMDFSLFRSWWSFLPDLRPVDDF